MIKYKEDFLKAEEEYIGYSIEHQQLYKNDLLLTVYKNDNDDSDVRILIWDMSKFLEKAIETIPYCKNLDNPDKRSHIIYNDQQIEWPYTNGDYCIGQDTVLVYSTRVF